MFYFLNYKIEGILQEPVYKTKINEHELREYIIVNEWGKLDQRINNKSVNWKMARLRACVVTKGGQFEHKN